LSYHDTTFTSLSSITIVSGASKIDEYDDLTMSLETIGSSLYRRIPSSAPADNGGNSNILDSDASAARDLVAFVKTIDERTNAFPAADLAPNDPTFADAAALCDCAKDPPLGTPAIDCRP